MSHSRIMPTLLLLLLASLPANAQWVEFADETADRLVLTTVTASDDEEKDIAKGDLDQDGWEDIIIVRKEPFSNPGPRSDVLLMNEFGVLTERTSVYAPEFLSMPTDARDVQIRDFTGDGWLDVVIANTFDQQPTFYRNLGSDAGTWLGLVNESAARFPVLTPVNQSPGPLFCAVWPGDIDNDLDLDLYFSNYNPGSLTEDFLLINDGTGVFTNESVARLGAYRNVAFGSGCEIHDVNGDQSQDIIKVSTLFSVPPFNDQGIFILFNDGAGNFDTMPFQRMDEDDPYMFAMTLLDSNRYPDMYIVSDFQDQIAIGTSRNPDGTVNYTYSDVSSSNRTDGFGGNLRWADLDNDGDQDIGVGPVDVDIQNCSGGQAGEIAWLRNDNLSFSDPYNSVTLNVHSRPHDFEVLDINKDGCLDLFYGLCTGWQLFIQDGGECATTSVAAGQIGRVELGASPSPFRGSTTVLLALDQVERSGQLEVEIFNVAGARVRTLFSGDAVDAPTRLDWDGRDEFGRETVADVYFVKCNHNGVETQRKIIKAR